MSNEARAMEYAAGQRDRPLSPDFLLATALYLAIACYFLWQFRYSINTDATSYISIAQKYARGDFRQAVNSIWQPLFSWTIAPFIFLGVEPLLAAKVSQVISGVFILLAVRRLSLVLPMRELERNLLMFTLVPVVVQFTFFILTPDLLLAGLLLMYFSIVLDPAYPSGRLQPALCGFWGGMAFLAKAYALPFFIAHFTLVSLLQAGRTGQWKRSARAMAAGFCVFFIVIAAWSAALTVKYGKFTINAAFGFNASASLAGDWPIPVQFREPVNPTAISVWEDPSMIYFEKPTLSFDQLIKKEIRKIFFNVSDAFGILNRFSPLSVSAIILALSACVVPGGWRKDPSIAALLVTACLLVAGYLPVNLETRYIWAALILLAVIVFVLISRLLNSIRLTPAQQNGLLLLVCLSFISGPLLRMDDDKARQGRELHAVSRFLAEAGVRGNIASDSNWEDSLYLVFFLKGRYYGAQQPGLSYAELREQLRTLGIQYYFWWRDGPEPVFLRGAGEVTRGRIRGLRVYRLNGGADGG